METKYYNFSHMQIRSQNWDRIRFINLKFELFGPNVTLYNHICRQIQFVLNNRHCIICMG